MAEATTIAELRRLINEPTADPYTDEVLGLRLDAHTGTLNQLAAILWREKAAKYAGLIDIKEGNSDRKLSQLHKQALAMADGLGGSVVDVELVGARRSRTRPIERM